MRVFFWCVEYLASFIEIMMCCYFCATFIAKEKLDESKYKIILCASLTSILIFVMNHINLFSNITTALILVLCIAIQWILHRKKYILSIGLVFVYAALLAAIDFMIIYFVSLFADTDLGYILSEQSFVRVACILLSKSVLIILVLTLNRLITYKKRIPPLYIVIMGMCAAFLLISNFVLIHSELNKTHNNISGFTLFFFISSIGIELIVFAFVFKIVEGYEQRNNNLLIELNNKMLQKSLDETEKTFELWRQSIHDYKNHIIVLTQWAKEEKLDDIKKYLQNENQLLEQKMFYIKTGNSVIDTIVNTKQNIAEKYKIVFMVNINLPPSIIIGDMDISSILGNLIDNAIEASKEEKEPYVEINIKQEKSFLIFNIKNKCTKEYNIDEIKTSKSDSKFHGIGLKSVRKTVNKYDGRMTADIINQEFIVSILIQNVV